eukprot:gb/GECG01004526.1/.p1 GENE.gb/GECG01004526.1/~~gb/GECG01004526.1/.p1  ORF type:complete len:1459 (+),score=231.06 gb/GECG01004526.1/:1-4377(+)
MSQPRRQRRYVKGDETYSSEVHPIWRKVPVETHQPPPRMRDGYTSARVGDKIYIIGGVSVGARPSHHPGDTESDAADDESEHGTFRSEYRINDVAVYDINDGTWSVVQTKGDRPRPRSHHAAVAVGNRIYIHGGEGATITRIGANGSATNRGSTSSPRGRRSSSVEDQLNSGRNLPELHRDMFYLDTLTLTWYRVDVGEGSVKKSKDQTSSSQAKTDGGESPADSNKRRGSLADERPDLFESHEEVRGESAIVPDMRRCHTLAFWMNNNRPCLVMFGGFTRLEFGKREDTPLNDVYIFDIIDSRWRKVDMEGSIAPAGRGSHASIVMGNSDLWVYGGYGKQGAFGDLWSLDLNTKKWKIWYNRIDAAKQLAKAPREPKQAQEETPPSSARSRRSFQFPASTPKAEGSATPRGQKEGGSSRSFSFYGARSSRQQSRSKQKGGKREEYPLPDASYGHRLEQDPWNPSRFLLCGGRTRHSSPSMTLWAFDTEQYHWNWVPATPEDMSPVSVSSDPAEYSSRKQDIQHFLDHPQTHRVACEESEYLPWPRYYFIMHSVGLTQQETRMLRSAMDGFPGPHAELIDPDDDPQSRLQDLRDFCSRRRNDPQSQPEPSTKNEDGSVPAPPTGWGSMYSAKGSRAHRLKRREDGTLVIEKATLQDKQDIRNEYDFKRIVVMGGIYVEEPSTLIKKNAKRLSSISAKVSSGESKQSPSMNYSNPLMSNVAMLYKHYVEMLQQRMQEQSLTSHPSGKSESALSYRPNPWRQFTQEEFQELLLGEGNALQDEPINNNDPDFLYKWRDRQALANARDLVFSLTPSMGLAQVTDVFHICFPPLENERSVAKHQGVSEEFLTERKETGSKETESVKSSRRSSKGSMSRRQSVRSSATASEDGSQKPSGEGGQNVPQLPAVTETVDNENSLESTLFKSSVLVEEALQENSDDEGTPKFSSIRDETDSLFIRKSDLSMCDPMSGRLAGPHIMQLPQREAVESPSEKKKQERKYVGGSETSKMVSRSTGSDKLGYLRQHLPLAAHQRQEPVESCKEETPIRFPPEFLVLPGSKIVRNAKQDTASTAEYKTYSPTLRQQRERTTRLTKSEQYQGRQLAKRLLEASREKHESVDLSNSLKQSAASIISQGYGFKGASAEDSAVSMPEQQEASSEQLEVSSDEESSIRRTPGSADSNHGEDPFPDVVPNEYLAALVTGASYASEIVHQNQSKTSTSKSKQSVLKHATGKNDYSVYDELRTLPEVQLRQLVAQVLEPPALAVSKKAMSSSSVPVDGGTSQTNTFGCFARLDEGHVPGTVGRRLVQSSSISAGRHNVSASGDAEQAEEVCVQPSARSSKSYLDEKTAAELLHHGIISVDDTHRGAGISRADISRGRKRQTRTTTGTRSLPPVAAAQAQVAANKVLREGKSAGLGPQYQSKHATGGSGLPLPDQLKRDMQTRKAQIDFGVDYILRELGKRQT